MRKLISLGLLIIALVAGYYLYGWYDGDVFKPPFDGVVYKTGNTTGNISNSGYLTRFNNQLIGNINSQKQGIYKSDLKFKNLKKLVDDEGLYLNTDGIWVYYVNVSDNNSIYRVNIDGTGRKKIVKAEASWLNWQNGWLYYIDDSKKGIIVKLSADGKVNKVLIDEGYCTNLVVKDGWAYFIQEGELNRINIDGGDRKGIAKVRTVFYEDNVIWRGSFDISGYYVYYPGEDGCLYKVRIDGKENKLVKKGGIESIHVYNGYVYYFDYTKKSVYRFNEEDPTKMDFVVGGGFYYNLNIVNNDGVLYKDKASLDGPLYMVLMNLFVAPKQ